MSVKAKFRCISVTDFGNQKRVKLEAVYSSNGENADFAKATPSGNFEMTVDAETKAAGYIQPQKYYYLNIEEAPAQ